jgi:hypothetical protein
VRRRHLLLALLAISQLGTGCRTLVRSEPEPPAAPRGFELRGRLEYDGDPQYLPRTLIAAPSGDARSGPILRLRYQVHYRHSSNAQILNPLVLFGGRFIGTDVTAHARLEILAGSDARQDYERTCLVSLRRSVWVWEQATTSELRRRALSCVRDLLDADLHRDRDRITALLERRAQ